MNIKVLDLIEYKSSIGVVDEITYKYTNRGCSIMVVYIDEDGISHIIKNRHIKYVKLILER